MDDATKQLAASQVSAGLAHAAAENVGTAFAAKEAAAERRSSEAELEAVHARATFILTELEPAVVSPAQVAEVRHSVLIVRCAAGWLNGVWLHVCGGRMRSAGAVGFEDGEVAA